MTSSYKVVLLAAGKGQRFATRGYAPNKCNLPIGHPLLQPLLYGIAEVNVVMFEHVVGKDNMFVVKSPEVKIGPFGNFLNVRHTQKSAAASAYLASAFLSDSDPVLIVDTDNYFTSLEVLQPLLKTPIHSGKFSGTICTELPKDDPFWDVQEFPSTNWPFGYMRSTYSHPMNHASGGTGYSGYLSGINIDDPRDLVNIGGYFFSEWSLFKESFHSLNEEARLGERSASAEITVFDVVKDVYEKHSTQYLYYVPYETWKPCGSPMQYERNKGFK